MSEEIQPDFQHPYKNHTFKGKRDDEEIILLLRRHWLVLFFRIVPLVFGFIFLILVDIFSPALTSLLPFEQRELIFDFFQSFAWMFFWIFVFVVWIDYYFDVWIVTNERIVNIEQFALFRREISELEHSKIQDVTTEVKGIVPTLFGYGYVFIQTAGEKLRFVFKQVSDPTKVRGIIMRLQKHQIKKQIKEEGQILRGKD